MAPWTRDWGSVAPSSLGQKSGRTKVPRIFRIFVPNFPPEFCSEFSPIFSGIFVLRFPGNGDQKKFTKNPRPFSMQNSQADTEKIFTKCFWRAGKITVSPTIRNLVDVSDIFTFFFLLGGAEGGVRGDRGGGGGGSFFFYSKSQEGGCLPGGGGRGELGERLRGILGGAGLNIFFRGRNPHQGLKKGHKTSLGCTPQGSYHTRHF